MNRPAAILVVGAGPTGLTLALQASDHGATVRIVDRRQAIAPSRALIMHSPTLEGLRPLGVVQALLEKADVRPAADIHVGGRLARACLGDLALSDTAFPHLTLVRQADVEAVLAAALAERGLTIERSTEVVAIHDGPDGAVATLRSTTRTKTERFDFIIGCDGQASGVRERAGIAWCGGSYAEEVVLADLELEAHLSADIAHVVVGPRGVLLLFALGEHATWRLLATQPAPEEDATAFSHPRPAAGPCELQSLLDLAGLPGRITLVAWSARYPLQRRLAARFRNGRYFLAGDAAHAHSPALGQGMNLGIQDALNLGWKLAFAASADDPEGLLDSYERERRPFDRRVLALTHLAFWAEAGRGAIPTFLRGAVAPRVVPALPGLIRCRPLVARLVRGVSQLRTGYRRSPMSLDSGRPSGRWPAPGARLGDRAAVVKGQGIRLHALLAQPGVHVLLEREAPVADDLSLGPMVLLHRLSSVPGKGAVVVRPDGFVGLRAAVANEGQMRAWLTRVGAVGRVYTG